LTAVLYVLEPMLLFLKLVNLI